MILKKVNPPTGTFFRNSIRSRQLGNSLLVPANLTIGVLARQRPFDVTIGLAAIGLGVLENQDVGNKLKKVVRLLENL